MLPEGAVIGQRTRGVAVYVRIRLGEGSLVEVLIDALVRRAGGSHVPNDVGSLVSRQQVRRIQLGIMSLRQIPKQANNRHPKIVKVRGISPVSPVLLRLKFR